MSTKTAIFTATIRVVTDPPDATGFYWFKIPKRLVHAAREKQFRFFMSAKAERHGPFQSAEECDAAQMNCDLRSSLVLAVLSRTLRGGLPLPDHRLRGLEAYRCATSAHPAACAPLQATKPRCQ